MEPATPAPAAAGPAAAGPRHPMWLVQVLRATAALMVIAGHAQSSVAGVLVQGGRPFARSTLLPWGASVDLFFVVSGFIMVHASDRLFGRAGSVGPFLRRRLLRIVPLYWVVTSLYLLLLSAAHMKGGDPFPGAATILGSYAFLPVAREGSGAMFPIYDLGWTLNYELFFYALFAMVLALPRRRALVTLGVVLVLLVLLGPLTTPGTAALFWTRPILLDFGLGMAIGGISVGGARIGAPARLALAAVGAIVLLLDPAQLFRGGLGTTVANELPRVVFAGLPAAAILAAAVLGPRTPTPAYARPAVYLGDASYSLYLLHPIALIVMEKLAQKAGVAALPPGWVVAWLTAAAGIAIALAGYHWLERPMTRALHGRLDGPRRPVPVPRPIQEKPSC